MFWIILAFTTFSSVIGLYKLFNIASKSDISKALLYWEIAKIQELAEKRNIVPVRLDITNYISIGVIALCGMWYIAIIRIITVAGAKVLEKAYADSALKVSQDATNWAKGKEAQESSKDNNTSAIGTV